MVLLLLQPLGSLAAGSCLPPPPARVSRRSVLISSRIASSFFLSFFSLCRIDAPLLQGYIKMSRKNNNCGVASQPTYVVLN